MRRRGNDYVLAGCHVTLILLESFPDEVGTFDASIAKNSPDEFPKLRRGHVWINVALTGRAAGVITKHKSHVRDCSVGYRWIRVLSRGVKTHE